MQTYTKTFEANIIRQPDGAPLGRHASTMTLVINDAGDGGYIEWELPGLDDFYNIGLTIEDGVLLDFDGVHDLPAEAVELLREAGVTIGEEFL